jgi:hypothetical protein
MKKRLLWKKLDDMQELDDPELLELAQSIPNALMGPNYDLYSLQTNFKLTVDILQQISQIDGIERLSPVSQYQVIVGLPNSGFFDHKIIQQNIEDTIHAIDDLQDFDLQVAIEKEFGAAKAMTFIDLYESLRDSKPYWVLYLYPNGEFEIVTDIKNEDDFTAKLIEIHTLQQMVGGFVTSSHTY